jgi:hypothetical protein
MDRFAGQAGEPLVFSPGDQGRMEAVLAFSPATSFQ